MSNRIMAVIMVALMILVVVLFFECVINPRVEDKVVYIMVTPEPTETTINQPTLTPEPVYVIYGTPQPTPEPQIIYVTPEPTKEPQIVYVTSEPTPVITSEPVKNETKPTIVVITEAPTPEHVVTPQPTVDPDLNGIYKSIEKEMTSLVMSGGIYPDYDSSPTNDFYKYVEGDGINANLYKSLNEKGVDHEVLFSILRKPFEEGIAVWVPMEFVKDFSSINRLGFALECTICDSCERVVIENHPKNQNSISKLFDEIEKRGEYSEANELLLDYLCKYTVKNPNNPNERLIIACDD